MGMMSGLACWRDGLGVRKYCQVQRMHNTPSPVKDVLTFMNVREAQHNYKQVKLKGEEVVDEYRWCTWRPRESAGEYDAPVTPATERMEVVTQERSGVERQVYGLSITNKNDGLSRYRTRALYTFRGRGSFIDYERKLQALVSEQKTMD